MSHYRKFPIVAQSCGLCRLEQQLHSQTRSYKRQTNSYPKWKQSWVVTWLKAQHPAECNCPSHGLLWTQLQCGPYMLPDADTDLQQLAIPANVSRFETCIHFDYNIQQCALAANLRTKDVWDLNDSIGAGWVQLWSLRVGYFSWIISALPWSLTLIVFFPFITSRNLYLVVKSQKLAGM